MYIKIDIHTHTLYFLYPFIHCRQLGFFPSADYCEKCCYEYRNTGFFFFFWDSNLFSFEYILRSGITGSHISSIFNLIRTSILFYVVAILPTFPQTVYKGSHFSRSLPAFVICCLFGNRHPTRCETIYHFGFDLPFPNY